MYNFKFNVLTSAIFFATLSLTACGGSNSKGGDDSSTPAYTFNFDKTSGDIYTGESYIIKSDKATNIVALHGIVTKKEYNAESSTTSTSDSSELDSSNVWIYTPYSSWISSVTDIAELVEEFTITVGDNKATQTKKVQIAVNDEGTPISDPYFQHQWSMLNTGQNPFETVYSPVKGIDLNVTEAWKQTIPNTDIHITGKGVKVGIWDRPIDFNHPDLADRIQPIIPNTHDISTIDQFFNLDIGLSDLENNDSTTHGTCVSGIILGSKNNVGIRGIAYDSKALSFKYSLSYQEYDIDALLLLSDSENVDLVNTSINGYLVTHESPVYTALMLKMAKAGIPFIKSMGNGYFGSGLFPQYVVNTCSFYNTNCEFVQTFSDDRFIFNINVASLNALGKKSSYSSTGQNLWITGFGGEFGYYNADDTSPAIVSTLFSQKLPESLDYDAHTPWREKIDPSGLYTARMNGTSSATPSISGVVALMKQAKPNLSVPQVRYILAKTARNDKKLPTLIYEPITYNGKTIDAGWEDMPDNLRFSSFYGFGLADAGEAVKATLNCDNDENCKMYQEFPDLYTFKKAGTEACKYIDGSSTSVECSFSGLKDQDGNNISDSVLIDGVGINIQDLKYRALNTSENASNFPSFCQDFAFSKSEITKYDAAVFKASAEIELILTMDNTKSSVIKAYNENWYYDGSDAPLDITTNKFYRSVVNDSNVFKFNINSVCPIDLDKLNNTIGIKIYGYKK